MTNITKVFLVSSSELVADRRGFEIFINWKNKLVVKIPILERKQKLKYDS